MTKLKKTRSHKREAKIEVLLALLPRNRRESAAAVLARDDAEFAAIADAPSGLM